MEVVLLVVVVVKVEESLLVEVHGWGRVWECGRGEGVALWCWW